MAELSLNARSMKLVGLSIIGVFSLFGFFMVVLFGKNLVKIVESTKTKTPDMEAWVGAIAMITIGTVLVFMIVMAMA